MEKLFLTEILKGCPVGTPLYSPLFGDVTLDKVWCNLIEVEIPSGSSAGFDKFGRYFICDGAECLLFPSKDCRDWSKFVAPKSKPKPETEPAHVFKPFDRVLVRDDENCCWEIDFFDHYNQNDNFPYRVMSSGYCKYCIPYDGNEHLHNTWNKPKED